MMTRATRRGKSATGGTILASPSAILMDRCVARSPKEVVREMEAEQHERMQGYVHSTREDQSTER